MGFVVVLEVINCECRRVPIRKSKEIFLFFVPYLVIYVAVSGLSCGMGILYLHTRASFLLWHAGFVVPWPVGS